MFAIHGVLAAVTKVEELALDKDEAKELAKAISDVNAYYGKVIDPKVFAWIGLAAVAGKVYAPRAVAIKLRLSMTQAPAKQPMRPVHPQQQAPRVDPSMIPPVM